MAPYLALLIQIRLENLLISLQALTLLPFQTHLDGSLRIIQLLQVNLCIHFLVSPRLFSIRLFLYSISSIKWNHQLGFGPKPDCSSCHFVIYSTWRIFSRSFCHSQFHRLYSPRTLNHFFQSWRIIRGVLSRSVMVMTPTVSVKSILSSPGTQIPVGFTPSHRNYYRTIILLSSWRLWPTLRKDSNLDMM